MTNKRTKRRFQFSIRGLLAATFVTAMLCGGFVCVRNTILSMKPYRGPVESRSEFPDALQGFLEVARQEKVDIEELKVFCSVGGVFYDEYYWQTKASPEVIDLATTFWELCALDKRSYEFSYFWQQMPTSWRFKPIPGQTEYFASRGCVATEYGVVVMHDKTRQRLYFQYYFDF